jgi:hypothetical protein
LMRARSTSFTLLYMTEQLRLTPALLAVVLQP